MLSSFIGLMVAFAACKDPEAANDEAMGKILNQYVENTIAPAYTNLAAKSQELVDALVALQTNKTDANVRNACGIFLEARSWWEKSEAFLFGPANDFGIDPHIDSWPLDEDGFTYGLYAAQERGRLFVGPGVDVYEGMIVGACPKNEDIRVILKGGDLIIRYTDDAVFMTGNCERVFTGEMEI